jgi:type III pantothenate kinase
MNLTIDIGNTFIKTIIFSDTVPIYRNVSRTLTANYIERLKRNFEIKDSMVSSVVNLKKPLLSSIRSLPRIHLLNAATKIPIKNLYKTPATLGKDRLANAIAGAFLFPGKNVLIIDVGTCIKYDFINSRKQYLGGSISPGLDMRFRAMHEFTGKLPMIKMKEALKKNFLTGSSTQTAMETGVIIGMTEEISGFINRYKKKYNTLKIILTGGDSKRFAGQLNLSIFAAEDLVNIGLNEIIRFNKKTPEK